MCASKIDDSQVNSSASVYTQDGTLLSHASLVCADCTHAFWFERAPFPHFRHFAWRVFWLGIYISITYVSILTTNTTESTVYYFTGLNVMVIVLTLANKLMVNYRSIQKII